MRFITRQLLMGHRPPAWDFVGVDPSIGFSFENRTATVLNTDGVQRIVRANAPIVGKKIWCVQMAWGKLGSTTGQEGLGVGDATVVTQVTELGTNAHSSGFRPNSLCRFNGAPGTAGGHRWDQSVTAPQWILMAADPAAGLWQYSSGVVSGGNPGWNGNGSGAGADPVAGVGGLPLPAGTIYPAAGIKDFLAGAPGAGDSVTLDGSCALGAAANADIAAQVNLLKAAGFTPLG